jgi:hypothetical protein
MYLAPTSIIQMGQLVENWPEANGSDSKWKQPADMLEAGRPAHALFASLFHMSAATRKRGTVRPSIAESGKRNASPAEQNKDVDNGRKF